jgi:hypothetical protein
MRCNAPLLWSAAAVLPLSIAWQKQRMRVARGRQFKAVALPPHSILVVLLVLFAATARADSRLFTSALLVEPGQAAPSIHLRNIAANGKTWDLGIDGWTVSGSMERPLDRGHKFFAAVQLTPYNAHSSRRIYADGARARELEFDSASYTVRGGLRFRHNDRASTEVSALAGYEVNDFDAWSSPYAGVLVSPRYRRLTSSDPFTGSITGIDVTALGELYAGDRTWSRATLTETWGRPLGRLHLRQSAALFTGSNLDQVSSFLVGGSWDVLGPTAIYGRRYAEFRVTRGLVANIGADYPLTPRWNLGARVSAFRAPGLDADDETFGAALQTTFRIGGARVTLGGASSGDRRMIYAMLTAAAF